MSPRLSLFFFFQTRLYRLPQSDVCVTSPAILRGYRDETMKREKKKRNGRGPGQEIKRSLSNNRARCASDAFAAALPFRFFHILRIPRYYLFCLSFPWRARINCINALYIANNKLFIAQLICISIYVIRQMRKPRTLAKYFFFFFFSAVETACPEIASSIIDKVN